MKQRLLFLSLLATSVFSFSQQKRILVFHETNGFRHGAIGPGITMFENLGEENGDWETFNSDDSSVFNTANLSNYDAVVFLNTSGGDETNPTDFLLTDTEKQAFENFIASGKGFIGVHAATDTYRDGEWPFYNELVGAIVQTRPNHTRQGLNRNMTVLNDNSITDFLGPIGTIWNKNEEYYYWRNNGGQLSNDNTVLLQVDETIGPNGRVNNYDEARPMAWFKESLTYNNGIADVTVSGFRSFYTALGHNSNDYNNDTNFRTMLKNATLWAIGETLSIQSAKNILNFNLVENPVNNIAQIQIANLTDAVNLEIYNVTGKKMLSKTIVERDLQNNIYTLDTSSWYSGIYFIKLKTNLQQKSIKFIKR